MKPGDKEIIFAKQVIRQQVQLKLLLYLRFSNNQENVSVRCSVRLLGLPYI